LCYNQTFNYKGEGVIEYRKGNLLDVQTGVIAHGVNCQGVMGSGVALAVRQKYPEVYTAYSLLCLKHEDWNLLGRYQFVSVGDNLAVVNLFTQLDYGRGRSRYVSYDAIDNAFRGCFSLLDNETLNIPAIGAGLGGGNWKIISSIIEAHQGNHKVICWEL